MALRIIYDNAADRTATLTASTTVGSLVASNLQSDIKSAVWRATTTSGTITATWTTSQLIGGIVLPFTNLTSGATIRVRGYAETADTSTVFDTGTIYACPPPTLGTQGWGSTLLGANGYESGGANTFSQGKGSYARAWLDAPAFAKKVVIDLVDTTNNAGYIEAGRLVIGSYWESKFNAEMGAAISIQDSTKQYRNDSGDLMSDLGTKHKKQNLNLPWLSADDRTTLWRILRGNGTGKPVFVSVFPNGLTGNPLPDYKLEQTHQMYCRLVATPQVITPFWNNFSTTIDIEEV